MKRRVEPEWLDELPPDHPGAVGSRRDLRRLNAWMGNASIMSRQLARSSNLVKPASITELGAGDGWFMLEVAKRLPFEWAGTRVLLVDKQRVPAGQTGAALAQLGWQSERLQADVLRLSGNGDCRLTGAVLSNLFLHHFSTEQLRKLFRRLVPLVQVFVAVEPRRSGLALAASRLVAVIGCNGVTRHDAPVSVRAGFTRNELSVLWPPEPGWSLQERRAGCFSHLFVARRIGGRRQ